jgi:hypothetical protein
METISELVDATLARYGVAQNPCGADIPVREAATPSAGMNEPRTARDPGPLPSGF